MKKTLLLALLMLSTSIVYSDQDTIGLVLEDQAGQSSKRIAEMSNITELDNQIQTWLKMHKKTLEECEDPSQNRKVCDNLISFLEKVISFSAERKSELESAASTVNSASEAEAIASALEAAQNEG